MLTFALFVSLLHVDCGLVVEAMLQVLGVPSRTKSAVFFNIVQKAVDPPPPRFEHVCCKFF